MSLEKSLPPFYLLEFDPNLELSKFYIQTEILSRLEKKGISRIRDLIINWNLLTYAYGIDTRELLQLEKELRLSKLNPNKYSALLNDCNFLVVLMNSSFTKLNLLSAIGKTFEKYGLISIYDVLNNFQNLCTEYALYPGDVIFVINRIREYLSIEIRDNPNNIYPHQETIVKESNNNLELKRVLAKSYHRTSLKKDLSRDSNNQSLMNSNSNKNNKKSEPNQFSSEVEKTIKNPDQNREKTVKESRQELISNICNNLEIIRENSTINISLDSLNLSSRTKNCLKRAGIFTLNQFTNMSIGELITIRHLGEKALREIQAAEKTYIQNKSKPDIDWQEMQIALSPEIQQITEQENDEIRVKDSCKLRLHIQNTLFSYPQSANPIDLSIDEIKIMESINQIIEEIGIDLCRQAFNDPEGTKKAIYALKTFFDHQASFESLQKMFTLIPEKRRTNKLSPYIQLFRKLHLLSEDNLSEIFSSCTNINDIEKHIVTLIEYKDQRLIEKFLMWLSFDILDFVNPILEKIFDKGNKKEILFRRATGETLEEISQNFGVTRERIRQIEYKVYQDFSRCRLKFPILEIISAELNDESIITSNEIYDLIPGSESLIYLLKKHLDFGYRYYETIDCFYRADVINPAKAYDLLADLPKFVNESEREALIQKINHNNGFPRKFLDLAFKKNYQLYGTVWHAGKINQKLMYGYVIEKYFPNGFRIYDSEEIARFRKYLHDEYGDFRVPENDRALWGRIQRICVLYDRGVYIHPSRVSIPDDLLRRIEAYFIDSGRTSISFHELYEKFENELLIRANIRNRFSLQGILKQHFRGKYYFYRDGFTIDERLKLTEEIEEFILENSPVSKYDLKHAFSGITDAMMYQILMRLSSVISLENSMYIHAADLKITLEDYQLKKLLKSLTKDGPITASKLLENLYSVHSDFLIRNKIHSSYTLFSILQYMFSDEFNFSRPYISAEKNGNISRHEIILSLLKGRERVGFSELVELCKENRILFQSYNLLLRLIQEDYIRIDEDTLVSIAKVCMTDEKQEQIKELLTSSLLLKGYIVFNTIDNLIFYPDIGIPWTTFLLQSVINKYFSEEFFIIDNTHGTNIVSDLIVDRRMGVDNYEDLIRSVIRSEHARDPFKDLAGVVKWLSKEGLINNNSADLNKDSKLKTTGKTKIETKNIPKFITNDSFISLDEYGKLIVI